MLDLDAIAEVEERVRQMDALPRGLQLLKQAAEAIATALSIEAKIQMEDSRLSVRSGGAVWIVTLENNHYRGVGRKQANAWEQREQSTSKLAWSMIAPAQYLRVRAVAAARTRPQR